MTFTSCAKNVSPAPKQLGFALEKLPQQQLYMFIVLMLGWPSEPSRAAHISSSTIGYE
jgi:hypothetical protein